MKHTAKINFACLSDHLPTLFSRSHQNLFCLLESHFQSPYARCPTQMLSPLVLVYFGCMEELSLLHLLSSL